jgi:YidC/Oxa1 family membrane protein insertase
MSLLDPLTHALAALVAGTHTGLTTLGVDPAGGLTWLACIAAVVIVVRLALLPFVVHGVRLARAAARARPQLTELTKRYQGRTDLESLRKMSAERRRIAEEHRMSRLGCLPLLLQLPFWLALYQLLSQVAGGQPVGALDAGLVASLGGATVLGVRLAERGYLTGGPAHAAVVIGLAAATAAITFATQRFLVLPTMVTDGLPEQMAQVQQLLPVLSAGGMIVAGAFVPVAMLAYWLMGALWTLGQSAVVWRWFPTPGSAAALGRGL